MAERDRLRTMPPKAILTSAHANDKLADAPYLAYCLVQACKHFLALVIKRWPELG